MIAMMNMNMITLFSLNECCVWKEELIRLKLSARNRPAMIPMLIDATELSKTMSMYVSFGFRSAT